MFVRMWMTRDPVTVAPETPISEAREKMEQGKFQRVPVVKGDKLAGILTYNTLVRARESGHPGAKVQDIMTRDPLTAEADEPIEEAAVRMRNRKIGALPVTKRGALVGIITESDVFDALMRIMGYGLGGLRVTFDLDNHKTDLPRILEMVKKFYLDLVNIASYDDPSTNRRIVTLRLKGEDLRKFVDVLWNEKYRVLRVTVDDQPLDPPAGQP